MTIAYSIICVLCGITAAYTIKKKKPLYGTFFTMGTIAFALYVIARIAGSPLNIIASWAATAIAIAALTAFTVTMIVLRFLNEEKIND